MGAVVNDQADRVGSVEVGIGRLDLGHGGAGEGRSELGGRFLRPVLAEQCAGGREGVDIREIDEIAQPLELPAHAVVALHLVHAGEETAADRGPDAFVHGP